LSMIGAPAKVGAPGVGVAGGECIASPLELLPSPIMRERALRVAGERAFEHDRRTRGCVGARLSMIGVRKGLPPGYPRQPRQPTLSRTGR